MNVKFSSSLEDLFSVLNSKDGAGALKAVSPKADVENGIGEAIHDPSFMAVNNVQSPAVLSWEGLTVTAKVHGNPEPKILLNNLSGTITGGFWAIMGPSGSGKTTFLGVLSKRLDTRKMPTTGTVHLNGKPYTDTDLKMMSGYVMQDDLLHAYLTVHETLMYTALLRMPRKTTPEERAAREDEVLNLMGIKYCSDVIIGDSRNKGVSGGERKRVAVAVELLTSPKLLFLDEPTSGLDSTSALALCSRLREMVDKGLCTVVCTIHQPQSKIFKLFDNLILMKRGFIMYQGKANKVVEYMAQAGHPCPPKENPADHIMDTIADKDASKKTIARLTPPANLDFGAEKEGFMPKDMPMWFTQFSILLRRNLYEWRLRWYIIVMNVLLTAAVSSFIGTGAWYQIGNDQTSIAKRNAILWFCSLHQGVVASIQGSYSFPLERAIFMRERAAGTYYVGSYFCGKFVADMVVQTPMPILFTIFVYPLCGLRTDNPECFFIFMLLVVLTSAACTAMSNMIACIFVSIELATVILVLFLEICRLYSGFFISPLLLMQTSLFYNFKFADAMSYLKYSYVGLCVNEYRNLAYTCTDAQIAAKKCVSSGNATMAQYGYDQYQVGFCIGMLFVIMAVCRYLGYLGLMYIRF